MSMLVMINQIIALLVLFFLIKYFCLATDFIIQLTMALMGDLVDMAKRLR